MNFDKEFEQDEEEIRFFLSFPISNIEDCKFELIPGIMNEQLYFTQTGEKYCKNVQKKILEKKEESSSTTVVNSKNKPEWEESGNKLPKGAVDYSHSIAGRMKNGQEYLSIFGTAEGKVLYLRIPNKSLRMGKYDGLDKWEKLIKDFNDGKSIEELEKYCE